MSRMSHMTHSKQCQVVAFLLFVCLFCFVSSASSSFFFSSFFLKTVELKVAKLTELNPEGVKGNILLFKAVYLCTTAFSC